MIRIVLAVLIAVFILSAYHFGWVSYLNFETLKNQQSVFWGYYNDNPLRVALSYFLIYVITTALSIPGATILTLAGGATFGFWTGLLIVSVASTAGATLSFIGSRYFFRDSVSKRFPTAFEKIDRGIREEGAFYLFSLRLLPVIPFFLINLVMGLTSMRIWTFAWVSQVGMLLGTAVYVNAGTRLGELQSARGILSPELIISFVAIGILPFFSKRLIEGFRAAKAFRPYKRPKKFDYNLVVIGAGSGGLVSAYIAAAIKAKVALVEKSKMGGDCLNTGCVPSKAIIRSANVLSNIKQASKYGFEASAKATDLQSVMSRVRKVIQKVAPHDSVERYTSLGVEVLRGEATIQSPWSVEVKDSEGRSKTLTTRGIVIATGAQPAIPTIPGLDSIQYTTSETIWGLTDLPKRLLVLGAGSIGCELAQAFARLGSKTTLVERRERVLHREYPHVSEFIEERLKLDGIDIFTNCHPVRFSSNPNKLLCKTTSGEITIEFDSVLIALGRTPRTQNLGLDKLGIEIGSAGTIRHDSFMRTNIPNIYVCGDVAGPYQFTHVASHQAWYASVNSLFSPIKKFPIDYRVIPTVTFTDPEVAHVGLDETLAKKGGISYEISHFNLSDLDRAIAEDLDHGWIQVLTRPGKDEILGVTIVATHASEMIAEYVLAMKHRIGLNKILGTIHAYPTWSEANKYVAGRWKQAHAPKRLLKWVELFHRIRR